MDPTNGIKALFAQQVVLELSHTQQCKTRMWVWFRFYNEKIRKYKSNKLDQFL